MLISFMGGAHSTSLYLNHSSLGLFYGGSKIDPTNTINFV